MKIALACDWFLPRLGGIETHLHDLATRLRARGHEVHVITPTPGPSSMDDVVVHRIPALLFPGFRFACNPAAFAAIGSVLRTGRFDVVHAHASIVSPAAYAAALTASAADMPAIVSFHSVLRNHAWWMTPIVRAMRLPDRGVWFTGVSGVVAREAESLLGVTGVAVLSNAVEAGLWRVERRDESGDAGEVHVVSVMRLEPKKRPKALVRAAARIRRELPDVPFRLTIVGDGSQRRSLARLVRSLGLSDIVELTGRLTREQIRDVYARAHVFALPTTLESFGIAVLEARAAGLPVVVMKSAGVSELLAAGVEGMLVESDREFAGALARLIRDRELRESMAEHNRATTAPACWEAVLQAHEEMYARVVRG